MIIAKHGSKEFKIPIQIDGGEEVSTSTEEAIPKTFGELREQISNLTGCDLETMKLILKGKFLIMPMDYLLENMNLKNNDKIMVIGVSTIDPGFKALASYERNNLTKLNAVLKGIEEDLAEMERNFLEGDMLKEMMRKMDKRLKQFTETSLQHLEAIDALQIYGTNITEE